MSASLNSQYCVSPLLNPYIYIYIYRMASKSKSKSESESESTVFEKTVRSFARYHEFVSHKHDQMRTSRLKQFLSSPSSPHISAIPPSLNPSSPEFSSHLELFKSSLQTTQTFLNRIAQVGGQNNFEHSPFDPAAPNNSLVTWDSISKVTSVLKSAVREFSSHGETERAQAFNPLIAACLLHVPQNKKILVPGAGLGRLPLELLKAGNQSDSDLSWSVQGNEFSYHMLLAGDFLLNFCASDETGESFVVHPNLTSSTNLRKRSDMFKTCTIPDINPSEVLQMSGSSTPNNFSFTAGEFCEVYGGADELNAWGAVVTCFFIDTAPNFFTYAKVIFDCLEVGGKWINLGPLLHHWSGGGCSYPPSSSAPPPPPFVSDEDRYDTAIDMSFDEIEAILKLIGFKILSVEHNIKCTYTRDESSMMHNEYDCSSFVVEK